MYETKVDMQLAGVFGSGRAGSIRMLASVVALSLLLRIIFLADPLSKGADSVKEGTATWTRGYDYMSLPLAKLTTEFLDKGWTNNVID